MGTLKELHLCSGDMAEVDTKDEAERATASEVEGNIEGFVVGVFGGTVVGSKGAEYVGSNDRMSERDTDGTFDIVYDGDNEGAVNGVSVAVIVDQSLMQLLRPQIVHPRLHHPNQNQDPKNPLHRRPATYCHQQQIGHQKSGLMGSTPDTTSRPSHKPLPSLPFLGRSLVDLTSTVLDGLHLGQNRPASDLSHCEFLEHLVRLKEGARIVARPARGFAILV